MGKSIKFMGKSIKRGRISSGEEYQVGKNIKFMGKSIKRGRISSWTEWGREWEGNGRRNILYQPTFHNRLVRTYGGHHLQMNL